MSEKNQNKKNAVFSMLKTALLCQCPKCKHSTMFKKDFLVFDLEDQCTNCGLDLSRSDAADGPAVFLIFVLGFLLVPVALTVEMKIGWPIWLHLAVWGGIGLAMTLWSLKPIKALAIALQYKFRESDWDENPPPRA
tara:strand:- start:128979 stop:129386 length:408 start_codon:yes stop_codon:yes gene_type:complete